MLPKMMAVILSASILVGCSAFRSPKQSISIMTNVPTADIFVNGNKVGHGTAQLKVRRNRDVQIMAKNEGYETSYYHIDSLLNTTGVLDLVGTFLFLFPIIGIFFPGAKSLDETNVALNLDPVQPQNN